MNFLNENWMETGNTLEEFRTAVKTFSAQTEIETQNMDSFQFLSLVDIGTELAAFPMNTRNLWKKTKSSMSLKKYQVDESGKELDSFYDSTTIEEALKNGLFVHFMDKNLSSVKSQSLFEKGKYIPVSEKAINTLANRAKSGGTSFSEPGIIRDLTLASKFSKPVPVSVIYRTDPDFESKKIFAVMSDKYTAIPQETLLYLIDNIKTEAEKDLGIMECYSWSIDHSLTRIFLEFPECAIDFAEEYKLPDEIVPGIMIETSDIGDCALRVKGYFKLAGVVTYSDHEFVQIHTGALNFSEVMELVVNQIFPEYRVYPEKLATLMAIDLIDPSMSEDVRFKKMSSLYRDISKKIGLTKAIGKKREKALLEQLIAGINPHIDYTAYDVAQTFLTLPSVIEVENKTVIELISKTSKNVMDYDFLEESEEDEILVI